MVSQVAPEIKLMERGIRPRYLRYNRWDVEGKPVPGVVEWSERAEALPRPPTLSIYMMIIIIYMIM
jgi:hypothetical protein